MTDLTVDSINFAPIPPQVAALGAAIGKVPDYGRLSKMAIERFPKIHAALAGSEANDNFPSVIALTGAAGSGKTTAAIEDRTPKGEIITQARLHHLLDYDPDTGLFIWSNPTSRRVKIGRIAGNVDSMGYVQLSLDNRDYRAHRLAWLYINGEYPSEEIDHINMIRSDNRIANLRRATRHENARNRVAYANSTTGFKGVIRSRDKFSARITVDGKPLHLGQFDTPELANEAYGAAAKKLFGEFARAS